MGGPSYTQPLRMANPVITALDDRYTCNILCILLKLAPSACLAIRVYTFATHKPYSHQFLYFSPSPDIFYRALYILCIKLYIHVHICQYVKIL